MIFLYLLNFFDSLLFKVDKYLSTFINKKINWDGMSIIYHVIHSFNNKFT